MNLPSGGVSHVAAHVLLAFAWFTGKRRIHKMFQTYFFFMLFKEQVDSNVIGSRASMLCVIHCLLVYVRGGH